ncbi:MAG: hypothetical protein F8N15_00930, partial [Methanobacterium sp.]|nr:hypothetical protein [Methanobacterium sp.]
MISKSITISCQTRTGTILDGSNTSHIFSILNGFNVTINDLTLENARSDNGGAITSEGNLTLNNCDFLNNNATHYGGAVGYDSGYLTVNNSNFYNNYAGFGGALAGVSANLPLYMSLNNCYFFNNTANGGGAVFNTGYLEVNGSDFNANSATDGGAIYGTTTLIFSNSTFKYNHSNHLGGAVRYDSGYLLAYNCKFYNNSAKFNGGAIASVAVDQPLNMEITGCNFLNNTAQNGGAIFNTANATVKDSNFDGNSANNGGAIAGDSSDMEINDTSFENNHATQYGGAVGYTSGTLNAVNSVFNSNRADMNGGALACLGAMFPVNMIINECDFSKNSAQNGGAIFNIGNLTVKNCSIFAYNSADTSFGAIYNQGNTTLQNVQFYNNNCTMIGGAVGFDTGTLKASGCYFTGNSAGNLGGAISSANQNLPSDMYLTQCTFNNNTAGMFGGAVFSSGNITISESNFDFNQATQRGGAVSCEGANLTINNSIFSNNTSKIGGAIESLPIDYQLKTTQNLNVKNCKFISNSAVIGGAICIYGNYLNVTQTLFLNNSASTNGGAIDVTKGTMQFNSFMNNNAVNGKSIYVEPNSNVNADYNWWGTNLGPSGNCKGINISKWMILIFNANPSTLKSGQTSTITIDVLHDNGLLADPKHPDLYFHDPSHGCVPDELMNMTSTSGTLNPYLNLVNGTALSILGTDGVTDSYITISLNWDSQIFNTVVKMDNIAPVVTSIIPSNNTIITNPKSPIKIVFSEPVQPGNFYGNIQLYHNSDVIPTSKLLNGNILELIPLNSLQDGIYNVFIPTDALMDLVGNNLENTFNSSFTMDKIKPAVVYNNLKNGTMSIYSNKTIKLVFNKFVTIQNQQIYLKNHQGTSIPITVALDNNIVSIKPNIKLADGNYTLMINKGALMDIYGCDVSNYTLNITVDTMAPAI